MPAYKISTVAAGDIDDIVDFTVRAFGKMQAVAYHASLERTFQVLAE